jgi:hypothetical protein
VTLKRFASPSSDFGLWAIWSVGQRHTSPFGPLSQNPSLDLGDRFCAAAARIKRVLHKTFFHRDVHLRRRCGLNEASVWVRGAAFANLIQYWSEPSKRNQVLLLVQGRNPTRCVCLALPQIRWRECGAARAGGPPCEPGCCCKPVIGIVFPRGLLAGPLSAGLTSPVLPPSQRRSL